MLSLLFSWSVFFLMWIALGHHFYFTLYKQNTGHILCAGLSRSQCVHLQSEWLKMAMDIWVLVGVFLVTKYNYSTMGMSLVGHICLFARCLVYFSFQSGWNVQEEYVNVCMCVLVGVCRGSMYNKGNGLSWARARGHGCLPSVCLCYVHQVQNFVSILKYRVQFFVFISAQSTAFCFDL